MPFLAGPAGVAIATAIAGTAAAGASLYGAHKASSAATDAAKIQAKSADEALAAEKEQRDYERQQEAAKIARDAEQRTYSRGQFANYQSRLSPYANAGATAVTDLSRGLPSPAGFVPGSGGMVILKAPDGSIQHVPASHAEWYLQKGAVRV